MFRRLYSTKKKLSVGFVGLGQMGFPMARNLNMKLSQAKALLEFNVLDASSETSSKFMNSHQNVTICETPKQIVERSDVIVTMLPASMHVQKVYNGKEGLLTDTKVAGKMFLECSTIDPATAKSISAKAKSLNALMVDAPVSGGTIGAEAATLTFMVGIESESLFNDRVKPFLANMGKNIVYCGGNGNGQVAKITNNMLLGISMIGAAEAMNLGTKLGMDPKLLANVINTSSGRCWSTEIYNPHPDVMPNVPSSRGYTGGFGNRLIAKDLGLAVASATESKSTVTLGAIAHQIYMQLSQTKGFENKDFSSVFKWIKN